MDGSASGGLFEKRKDLRKQRVELVELLLAECLCQQALFDRRALVGGGAPALAAGCGFTGALAALLRADAGAWGESEEDIEQASEVVAELLRTGLNGLAGWWWDRPEVPRERLVELVMTALWTGLRAVHAGEG